MEGGPAERGGRPTDRGAPAQAAIGSSRPAALVFLGVFLTAYVVLFRHLVPPLGVIAPAISAVVPVVAGAALGWRWGAALGLLCMPMNVLLIAWAGGPRVSPAGHAVAALIFAVIGAAVGWGRELAASVGRSHADELRGVMAGARRTQQTLAERDAQFAQAQSIAHIGYWIVELGTGHVTWSEELCRILGEDPATAHPTEEAWWQHVHPEDRPTLKRNTARAMAEELPVVEEFRLVRPDGKTRWVFGRAQALRDESGKPVKLLGTLQDVTEQKELQGQLAAAERLATVGTLAAGVAHEINNPLASVISNLEFLLESLRRGPGQGTAPPALAAAAGEALQGAERVSRIVHDLMVFARPTEEAGPVDVERVLDLSLSMAAAETRYRARVVKDYGRVPLARGDASRLGQVFLSLLVNAAQAIPAGQPDAHEIRVTTRAQGDRIAVSIRDTGLGMTPEVRRRIFEPFFTTKPIGEGKGLGLSTSLAAVRAMGGDILAESEPGAGSTFTLTLPAQR